ncbi:DNA-binding NarL/FixJ family response regulator [Deinococcus metalli]|uniref:DNA-binding NarL/FixJ family response regulator n=1 Tax=Deinococcus metalli TaxID=1141878 RepID=A0A7W8KI72_9DEIO|nr:response regulator transcription factor [Deinococcus metalli]MBB5377491.1 DNA-binding NarL/FixJ family response regulator [Deinococcus metalli]GHF50835.1 DNA-binding response regulator [Deinococcus metalli]
MTDATEPHTDAVRIVIVDDHPLFREGVAATLGAESGLEVVGEGGSADDALRLCTALLPDLLLLDLNLPGGGMHAARAVTAACPVTKIVMLTFSEEEADVLSALKAGARGYILKGVSGRELRRIVRSVYAGEVYITPTLAAGVLVEMAAPGRGAHHPLSDLTPRERQILEGVASGRSNKEIGRDLDLTEKTVKHYMTNILQKLQVRNRVEAALLAQREAGR